jgi:hypothetical protein
MNPCRISSTRMSLISTEWTWNTTQIMLMVLTWLSCHPDWRGLRNSSIVRIVTMNLTSSITHPDWCRRHWRSSWFVRRMDQWGMHITRDWEACSERARSKPSRNNQRNRSSRLSTWITWNLMSSGRLWIYWKGRMVTARNPTTLNAQ